MINNFQQLLRHLMHLRHFDIDRLTKRDECRLMARYIREVGFYECVEFITQSKAMQNFPALIADFLEGRRNGDDELTLPDFSLSQTIGRAVLEGGEKIIEKAWSEEEESRQLRKKINTIFHREGSNDGS